MLRRGIFGGITKAPVRSPAFRRRSVETRPNPVAIFTESLLPPQFPSPNKTGPAFHRNPRSPGFRHVPRNCPIQSACHFQQGKPAALAPETFHHPAAVFESPDRSPPTAFRWRSVGTCPNPIATFTENPSTEPFAAANFPAQTKSRATFHRKPATTDSAAPQSACYLRLKSPQH